MSWLLKLHRQIGHRNNRTLVRLLRDRGTHPAVLRMAEQLQCDACNEARPPTLRHVVAAYETRPGYVLEIDGLHWVQAEEAAYTGRVRLQCGDWWGCTRGGEP